MEAMQPNAPRRLKLGDQLNGTIVKPIGGRRFAVACKGVPNGWTVELHTRRPESFHQGSQGTFWVAKFSPLRGSVLVHEGDFGRLPISDAMRSRYRAAVSALLGDGDLTADEISDAHSMILRVEKTKEADWLTVWRLLGEPATGDVKELLAAIAAIRTARKDDPESLPKLRALLKEKHGPMLQSAIVRLG